MSPENRWDALLKTSKVVLAAFTSGRNPTFQQVERLQGAVDGVEAERICGHRFIDGPCDCEEDHAE